MSLKLLCLLTSLLPFAACSEYLGAPVYESLEEWTLWKATHTKSYDSTLEELEHHIVWQSNKAYVDQHNVNAARGVFSYQVKLNHLADLVSGAGL